MAKTWVRRHPAALRERVREQRRHGMSIKQIAAQEGLSSSTVCLWVRDINLSDEQTAAIARRRAQLAGESFSNHIHRQHERWREEARDLWERWRTEPLFLLGVGMYWGEGDKRTRRLSISNADPQFVVAWLRWCAVYAPSEQVFLHVNIHPDLCADDVHAYWESVAHGASRIRIIRVKSWKRPGEAEVRLPYGVAKVFVTRGVEWHTKMLEWIRLAGVM